MSRLTVCSLILLLTAAHNILDFGAIENDTTWLAETRNARAIENAILAAHNKEQGDKTVILPEGTMISSLGVHVHDVQDVEIIIDGTIKASKNHDQWKNSIEKCPDIT